MASVEDYFVPLMVAAVHQAFVSKSSDALSADELEAHIKACRSC